MLEVIEKAKEEELIERRAKKKKAQEEEEAKKKVVEAEKKRDEQTGEIDQQEESSAGEANAESSAAATTSTEEPMAVSPPATEAVAGEAPIAMTTNAATPVQQTISETAVQLAEGLANAISAGVVNIPGISTAATATTTTTASVAAAISAAAPFSTGALQVIFEILVQLCFNTFILLFSLTRASGSSRPPQLPPRQLQWLRQFLGLLQLNLPR